MLLSVVALSLSSPLGSPKISQARADADDGTSTEDLPAINAITFPVTVERKSASGHVYLLSTTGDLPEVGRLILLKKDSTPIMAFRILKQYPDKKQFAGKWMRRYNGLKQLEAKDTYTAVEKLSDRSPESPLTNQDKKDLNEIEKPVLPPLPEPSGSPEVPPTPELSPPPTPELSPQPTPELSPPPAPAPAPSPAPSPAASEVVSPAISDNTIPPLPEAEPSAAPDNLPPPPGEAPKEEAPPPAPTEAAAPPAPAPSPEGFDAELDSGTSPPPKGSPEATAEQEPDSDDLSSVMVEEKRQIPRELNFVSLGIGVYLNYNANNSPSTSLYTPGGFIGYSRLLKQQIYFRGGKGPADDLAIDGDMAFYKILSLVNPGDAYTVVPLKADLRYTVMFTDDFGIFAYGGAEQNVVVSTVNPTQNAQNGLSSLVPAVGLGVLFRAGPSWYVRFDGGYDGVGLSLALRF